MGCGETFTAKTTVTKYCSHKCNSRHYKEKIKALKIKVADSETEKVIPQHIKYPEINTKDILSVKEVCLFIGVSRNTIYRLFDDTSLTPIKVRNRVFIKREEIKKVFNI
jgi:excisionase family DNA binding protein